MNPSSHAAQAHAAKATAAAHEQAAQATTATTTATADGSAQEPHPAPTRKGESDPQPRRALVTGATGYIGGSLVSELLERGWAVRTLSRSRDKAETMSWAESLVPAGQSAAAGEIEVVEGDATDAEDVARAMQGIDVAWYLLHSMSDADDLLQAETDMARTFADAAENAGISRIVYLAGLHPDDEELSEHLASRTAVGELLLDCAVPAAVLQAGVVLGSESASFIMLRTLSERLPGAIGPRWIRNRITPISVRDVLFYLASAAELAPDVNRTFDIGGPDTMEYAQMMQAYAKALGLPPHIIITAPVTTPGLAANWIGLVTPVRSSMARHLIGSLLNTTVVKERDLEGLVGTPPGGNQTFEQAVLAATDGLAAGRWWRVVGAALAMAGTSAGLRAILTTALRRGAGRGPVSRALGARRPTASLRVPWAPAGTRRSPAVRVGAGALDLLADAGAAGVSALVVGDRLDDGDERGAGGAAAVFAAGSVAQALGRAAAASDSRAVRGAGAIAAAAADAVRAKRAFDSAPERAVMSGAASAASALSGLLRRRNR